jgi:hypothetical protein
MKNIDTNHYAGWEIITHELKMRAKMFSEVFIVLGFLHITLSYTLAKFLLSAIEFELAVKLIAARISSALFLKPIFHIHVNDTITAITGKQLLSMPEVAAIANTGYTKLFFCAVAGGAVWLLVPLLLSWVKGRADKEMGTKHIRGMQKIDEKDLAGFLENLGEKVKGLLRFGSNIILPRKYESEHIFIGGKPRVGKSVLAKQHINAIRVAGHRAYIGDFKGEYVELFYDPAKDFILNPLDARGVSWNLFDELETKADLNGLCDSLIPDSQGDDRFWSAGSKAVFRGIMSYLWENNKKTMADLWKSCSAPVSEIAEICKATAGGRAGFAYIQDASGKQAAGIIAVMMSYVSWLEFAQGTGKQFSTRTFLSSKGFMFLTGRPEIESTIRPMTGLFVDLLCRRILSQADAEHDLERKTYIYLDEFGNLQKLPSIIRFATAAGSKGGVLAIAIQDYAAIQKTYGLEQAKTLFNACGTVAIFNVADPDTAEYFSKRFGRREYEYARKNYKMSAQDAGDGVTISRDEKESDLFLASEIQGLPKLQFFLKVPEHNPALVQLQFTDINNKKPVNEAFVMKEGFLMDDIVEKQSEIAEVTEIWRGKSSVLDKGREEAPGEERSTKKPKLTNIDIEMDAI